MKKGKKNSVQNAVEGVDQGEQFASSGPQAGLNLPGPREAPSGIFPVDIRGVIINFYL